MTSRGKIEEAEIAEKRIMRRMNPDILKKYKFFVRDISIENTNSVIYRVIQSTSKMIEECKTIENNSFSNIHYDILLWNNRIIAISFFLTCIKYRIIENGALFVFYQDRDNRFFKLYNSMGDDNISFNTLVCLEEVKQEMGVSELILSAGDDKYTDLLHNLSYNDIKLGTNEVISSDEDFHKKHPVLKMLWSSGYKRKVDYRNYVVRKGKIFLVRLTFKYFSFFIGYTLKNMVLYISQISMSDCLTEENLENIQQSSVPLYFLSGSATSGPTSDPTSGLTHRLNPERTTNVIQIDNDSHIENPVILSSGFGLLIEYIEDKGTFAIRKHNKQTIAFFTSYDVEQLKLDFSNVCTNIRDYITFYVSISDNSLEHIIYDMVHLNKNMVWLDKYFTYLEEKATKAKGEVVDTENTETGEK